MGDSKDKLFTSYYTAFSGSNSTVLSANVKQSVPRWARGVIAREFVVGDLVTLAPDYRYSALNSPVGRGDRYVGIVTAAYANREYLVIWTSHPVPSARTLSEAGRGGLYNGDHLLKIECADRSLV